MSKEKVSTDRSREKLKKFIRGEVTKLFTSVLDFTEVAVEGKDRFMSLRSKILKVSNDAMRDIDKELDTRYSIEYVPPAEDVIIIRK